MATINTVLCAGNLTRDPEMRALPSTSVVSFTLAMNRKWTDKSGEKKEEVTFIDCEAWGKTAELVDQYCSKGKNVLVEGRLKQDTWDDKETGKRQSKIKIVADRVHFLGGKEAGADGAPAPHGNADHRAVAHSSASAAPAAPAASIDEPPF